jgi:hypothetical protein
MFMLKDFIIIIYFSNAFKFYGNLILLKTIDHLTLLNGTLVLCYIISSK